VLPTSSTFRLVLRQNITWFIIKIGRKEYRFTFFWWEIFCVYSRNLRMSWQHWFFSLIAHVQMAHTVLYRVGSSLTPTSCATGTVNVESSRPWNIVRNSVLNPDLHWIRIRWAPGSAFAMRIRIRNADPEGGKSAPKKEEKLSLKTRFFLYVFSMQSYFRKKFGLKMFNVKRSRWETKISFCLPSANLNQIWPESGSALGPDLHSSKCWIRIHI
jgi:hypothetical protein